MTDLSDMNLTPMSKVRENYKFNQHNKWCTNNESDKGTAQARYGDDFFYVGSNLNGEVRFPASARIFTMGSCFARNIEEVLHKRGLNVLTDRFQIDPDCYTLSRRPSAVLNKFNIPSMLFEFERAFGGQPIDDLSFVKVKENEFFDTSTAGLKFLPIETLREIRDQAIEVNRTILEADIFIVTLGLVEMFIDSETGRVLNTSPHPLIMRKYPERFAHARPGYRFLSERLYRLIALLKSLNPSLDIVITVSPVPLQSTMLHEDVVASNTYSKSLLRVLAQEAVEKFANVHYYPSYEMVMNSPRAVTWESDQIHVQAPLVEKITNAFVEKWFRREAESDLASRHP